MSFRCFLVGILLGIFVNEPLADEVMLNPSRDTSLYSESGELSNGSGISLFAGNTRGRLGAGFRRALLGFDFTDSIPAGATIESVTFNLTVSNSVSDDRQFGLHKLLTNWGEGASNAVVTEGQGTAAEAGDATFSHAIFPDALWTNEGGDFVVEASAVTAVAFDGDYAWSSPALAADVQSWIANPDENFGWILRGSEDLRGSAKRFNSRENANKKPSLSVVFSVEEGLLGDFNGNQELDVADLNALTGEVIVGTNNPDFEVTGDEFVNQDDRTHWIGVLKNTFLGDSNFDLEFSTSDLVAVFAEGQYEDGIPNNSLWESGDWNGDLEFDTADLVAAFVEGGFEKGPKPVAANLTVVAVPEPSSIVLLAFIGILALPIRQFGSLANRCRRVSAIEKRIGR